MEIRTSLSLCVLAALSGCKDFVPVEPEWLPTDRINARKNGDGHYNVLFVSTDQEHYMSEYPAGTRFSAREKLRQMGLSFDNHYVCSNVSTPSRSVLYTGQHITATRMLDNTNYAYQPSMSSQIPTMGSLMRGLGYYTAYKGKWHLNQEHDFQAGSAQNGLEPYGFSDWNAQGDMHGEQLEGYYEDRAIAADACKWLRETGGTLNAQGRSFLLAVNLINPHDVMYFNADGPGENSQAQSEHLLRITGVPYHATYEQTYMGAPIADTWNEPFDGAGRVAAHGQYHYAWARMVGLTNSSVSNWERHRDYYYNCIQDSDNQLRMLLSELSNMGLLDNTIIVLTADHGEMMGAHGMKGKGGFMYENNIHVPLVIYHPEYPGGRRTNSLSSHLDIVPTVLGLAGADKGTLKGVSLLPVLENPSAEVRTEALFAFDMISMIDQDMELVRSASGIDKILIDLDTRGFVRGVVTKEAKFARYFSPVGFNRPSNTTELYAQNDVELFVKDPFSGFAEKENLAAKRPEWVERYNGLLNGLIDREIGVDDGRELNAFPGGITAYKRINN